MTKTHPARNQSATRSVLAIHALLTMVQGVLGGERK